MWKRCKTATIFTISQVTYGITTSNLAPLVGVVEVTENFFLSNNPSYMGYGIHSMVLSVGRSVCLFVCLSVCVAAKKFFHITSSLALI